jgi:hypothetical protein
MSIGVRAIRFGGEGRNEPVLEPRSDPMTATTLTASTSTSASTNVRPAVWRTGLAAGVVAAAATTAVAATALAMDVPVEIDGEAIPLVGFAQLTLFFTGIGILLARFIGRRSAFVATTVVLTALSLVPDLLVSASTATKLTLMLTHLVAAAIVIPRLASRVAEVH